jgi:hypothetical protein
VHHAHTDAFYVLEGELTFEIGAEAETIKVSAGGFLAAPPGVAHSLHNDSGRPARWLTIHTPDGGFAAFMRGVRDGVEVAWDISAVPEGGGLPASEAIVSPHLGRLTPRIRESAVLAIVAQARDSAAWTSRGHRRRPRKRAQQNGSRTN